MLALITAALQGLASIPKLIDMITSGMIASRLKALEQKQQLSDQAFMKLAAAKTDEDYANALKDIASSIGQ